VVVVVAQRSGPSTGLPTRTEQSDLRFVIHAAHGDFPRAVFAPGNAESAFYLMGKAFNMADRYQTPVIILGDQHLNDSYFTIEQLDPKGIQIDRGKIVSDTTIPHIKDYNRYAWDETGISPRILPGLSDAVLYVDSDEHTEAGHITESASVRKQMMEKRMRKLEGMAKEMAPPELYPSEKSDVILLGWGSTHGAIKEAVDLMNGDGLKTQMLHFSEIHPFPAEKLSLQGLGDRKVFAVENNYTGQFANYFSEQTGIPISHTILKYDGRPFSPQEIVLGVKEQL